MNLLQAARPRRFAGEDGRRRVLGQDEAVRLLTAEVTSGRGRSVLLHGPHGSGKETLGLIYANALLCTNAADGNPCLDIEACASCRDFADGVHPNFARAEGDAPEDDVVRALLAQPGAGWMSDDWQVILINEADGLSARVTEVLRRRLKAADRLAFILCSSNAAALPGALQGAGLLVAPMQPVPVPTRLALLSEVCDWLRKQDSLPATWSIETGALELLAELAPPVLGRALADLQSVLCEEGVTLARVRANHCLDESLPAARYLAAVLTGASFTHQVQALTTWEIDPAERIAAVEALLSALFRADVEHVVGAPALLAGLTNSQRLEIVDGVARRAQIIGLAPRRLWPAAMAVWRPDPWAREATLITRAAEFRNLLDADRGPPKRQAREASVPSRRRVSRSRGQEVSVQPDVRLKRDQVEDLWDAAAFAVQTRGQHLNTSILLNHDALGRGGEAEAQLLVTNLLSELRKRADARRLRDPAHSFYRLYVHARDDAGRLHTRIALHLPATMRDVEHWLRGSFLRRHGYGVPATDAVVVRLAREGNPIPLRRHLTLLRLLCRGIDPSIEVIVDEADGQRTAALATVLGVPQVIRRGIGPLTEVRRFETSRWIARDARKEAAARLPFVSAFAEQAWRASVRGHDAAERRAREAAAAEIDHVAKEFPANSGPEWQVKRDARLQRIRDAYVAAARSRLRARSTPQAE
ncbi:hypothetical protein [Methylorubrum extorquens]|uniref:hypothetical protein n=1 Tax=Methylorubrum extorquens TaxID=408 RepID=UPI0022389F59|nr:hypothetical protein [Methylorubrum extorquens]UYW33523.1 hypothetical protein OKB92_05425 [Methylorubrum extorquens]